tara:strand:+ start:149 stop:418 length:270 start_codon:yes stop_codon:yes gene_type:complete
MVNMHDWTLIDITSHWRNRSVILRFSSQDGHKEILANNFSKVRVPRNNPWGASVSVNKAILSNADKRLSIEMQSGDTIEIEAQSIELPE